MTLASRRGDHLAPSPRSPIPPQAAIVAPGASYAVALDPIAPEHASTTIGCGNAGPMETTERFPQRLGNLAQNARFPHSHSRLFLFPLRKNEEGEERNPLASHLNTDTDH